MKLIFMDFQISLYGYFLSSYNIEEGERIDFLCITKSEDMFNSKLSFSERGLLAEDFDFVEENDEIFLFAKIRQKGIEVYFQEEIYSGNERILATVFCDGKTYCSLESAGKYNVINLPKAGKNYKVFASAYGDNIFITYDEKHTQAVKIINSTNFECVSELNAKNVKIEDNKITTESVAHGIYKRITESFYSVYGENLIFDSSVHKCTFVNVRNHTLLGVIFMECVCDGDFESILPIIDDDLKSALDDIKTHFSQISDFYPTTKSDLFIYTKNGRKEKCQFIYEKGKICDILTD